ncbi:DUF6573 family protein [Gottfriedia acidiceleris]|uniref:DUF6573 family protein n=1 Tax=Gottfriedia acidiceleris TaxID=371036 RepID=UPI00339559FB
MIHELFGEVISMYTRAQAIEDGSLIDISKLGKEAGVKLPIAMTQTAYGRVVEPDEAAKSRGESVNGRLWDVLTMFTLKARGSNSSIIRFKVVATVNGRNKTHELKAIIGPGDTLDPVLTIMLPDED